MAVKLRCSRMTTLSSSPMTLPVPFGKLRPEPGLKLCRSCGEKRRAGNRARLARAKRRLYGAQRATLCVPVQPLARDLVQHRQQGLRLCEEWRMAAGHPVHGGLAANARRIDQLDHPVLRDRGDRLVVRQVDVVP